MWKIDSQRLYSPFVRIEPLIIPSSPKSKSARGSRDIYSFISIRNGLSAPSYQSHRSTRRHGDIPLLSGRLAAQITWLKNGVKTRRGLTINRDVHTSSLNLLNIDWNDQGACACQANSTEGVFSSKTGYLSIRNPRHRGESLSFSLINPHEHIQRNILQVVTIGKKCFDSWW